MKKRTSLVLLFLWPILASIISFLINANFFISTILFVGIPAIFLSFLNKKKVKKLTVFSLIFAIPISIILDYIMEATGGWYVPHSIFGSLRLFNFITIDLIIWGILEAYFILIFYETFLDKHCTPKLYYPNLKYLFIILYIALGVFILIYMFNPAILHINFFYLKMGIILAMLPPAAVLFKLPKFWNRFLNIAVYFFIFNFIYEVTAVKLGQWSFPAEHQLIGIVQFMGARFAFEELLFWMMLTAMSVVAFYEVFDDDRK